MKQAIMRNFKAIAFACGLTFCNVSFAASYTTLVLPTLTADIRTWTDGAAYSSLFPSSAVFDSVPFQLQLDVNGNNVFVGPGAPGATGAIETDIPVGVYGVSNVYTLINSAYGTMGVNIGSITFNGSAGASYTVSLIEGDNVRDHYYGSFVNSTSASYVTQAVVGINDYGHAHLDMQNFALPATFQTQTLTDIVFYSPGTPGGIPFLAGTTVAAIPEPETYAMLLAGLGLLGFMARHRKVPAA